MKILIVAAMDIEVNELVSKFKNNKNIDILVTGVGFANAAKLSSINFDIYDTILNIGVSGSLVENIKIGETFNISEVYHNDIDVSALGIPKGQLSKGPIKYLLERIDLFDSVSLASGSKFISDVEERILYGKLNNTTLVDMETAIYASICEANGLKLMSIRTVSDTFSNKEERDYKSNLDEACVKLQNDAIIILEKLGYTNE